MNWGKQLKTCGEAVRMLRSGEAVMAEFRPASLFVPLGRYKDDDPAFVWVLEG